MVANVYRQPVNSKTSTPAAPSFSCPVRPQTGRCSRASGSRRDAGSAVCMGNRHAVGRRKSVRRTGEVEALCDRLHPVVLREPWFAINAIDDDTDDGPGIIVILSDAVADRVTAMGRTAGIERIGKRRSIT